MFALTTPSVPRSIRLHPLIALAAGSVTVASLAVTASTLGWAGSKAAEPPVSLAAAAPPSAPGTVAAKPTAPRAVASGASRNQASAPVTPQAQQPIRERASTPLKTQRVSTENSAPASDRVTVVAVQTLQQQAQPTGVGAVAGGLIGGLIGNQIGGGSGRTLGAVVGAVGGGYAGHEIEKRVRSTTVHELTVRLADGSTRSFRRTQPWDVRVGDVIAMPESTSAAAPSKPRPAPSLPEPQPSETRA